MDSMGQGAQSAAPATPHEVAPASPSGGKEEPDLADEQIDQVDLADGGVDREIQNAV